MRGKILQGKQSTVMPNILQTQVRDTLVHSFYYPESTRFDFNEVTSTVINEFETMLLIFRVFNQTTHLYSSLIVPLESPASSNLFHTSRFKIGLIYCAHMLIFSSSICVEFPSDFESLTSHIMTNRAVYSVLTV
jgi:hypothetical protein